MCVTDVDVAVTNLRVVCKIITCVSAFTCTIQITVCAYVCLMDVGVAVPNLRVVCKNITCVSEMAILIFLEIVKAAAGLDTALQTT